MHFPASFTAGSGSGQFGDIVDHELHLAGAIPIVGRQPAGDVQGKLALRKEQLAQRGGKRAEGYGFQLCAVIRFDRAAHVIGASAVGIDHAVGGKSKYG